MIANLQTRSAPIGLHRVTRWRWHGMAQRDGVWGNGCEKQGTTMILKRKT